MRKNAKNSESGIALIMVLGVLAVLLILAVTFAFNMRLEQRAARNYLDYVSADYFAKAGIERAIAELLEQRGAGYYFDGSIWAGGTTTESITSDGIDLGRFIVRIKDESGRLNLNHAGNLAVEPVPGDFEHGANEGWTTYEISIEDFVAAQGLGPLEAGAIAEEVIWYRFDDSYAGGDADWYDEGIAEDGIDNDGSGDAGDSTYPFWFTPWKPRDGYGHQPFVAASQLYMVYVDPNYLGWGLDDWHTDWRDSGLGDNLTVHSRAGEGRTNINAVPDAQALYDTLDGIASDGTRAQKVVNIIDYRDKNDWITEFEYEPGERVYGVESILINEVLANSYENFAIGEAVTTVDGAGSGGFQIDTLPEGLVFRLKINLEIGGDFGQVDGAEVELSAEGDDPNFDRSYVYTYTGPGPIADTWYFDPVKSSAGGDLDFGMEITLINPEEPAPEFTLTVTNVELVCAEFIELVNIGGEDVELDGWEIRTGAGDPVPIPGTPTIQPGDYIVLTNDEFLFEESYGTTFNTVEITDWNSWDPAWTPADVPADFEDITNFPNNGNFDIYLYIEYTDPANYLLADLSINGTHIEQPDASSGIGVSREKNDPAIRDDWSDNADGGSTPGEDNSRVIGERGETVLDGLRAVPPDYPPLVANKHFATTGELFETEDWRNPADIKYAGVRSHVHDNGGSNDRSWLGIGAYLTPADAARRLIAGHYIRIYNNTDVRLDRNHGRMVYRVYEFDEDDDVEGSELPQIRAEDTGEIDSEGTPSISFSSLDYDYHLLIPDSIPGRVNINTARTAVLSGLPGFSVDISGTTLAQEVFQDRIANGHFSSLGNFVSRFEAIFVNIGQTPEEARISAKRHFAPIANLITVDSDVFRIESTGTAIGPQGDSATKTIEAIVDRSGGRIRILSWKVAD